MQFNLLALSALLVAASGLPAAERFNDEKIVGGVSTTIEKYPHQISLEYYNSHSCGGSILSEYFILTAAHCVEHDDSGEYHTVRVGSTYRGQGGQTHKVDKIWYHEKFSMNNLDYDVAVLKLKTPVVFNEQAQPVKIIDTNVVSRQGNMLEVSGWGTLSSSGSSPKELNAVRVPVVGQKLCSLAYEGFNAVTPRMICAAAPNKDSCQGDSGGPVINEDRVQVGIVSWGKGCAEPGYPGVYTNVADPQIHDFITEHAKL